MRSPSLVTRLLLSSAVTVLALVAAAMPASASTFGPLANFDAVNDTGQTAHGFEIELEGIHSSDIRDTFGGAGRGFPSTVERYGAPSISDFTNGSIFGARVTYQGTFNSGSGTWSAGTPSGVFNRPGESCWTGGGIGYGPSTPCDHFGVGTIRNPTHTKYSWLLETATPGALTNGVVNIPAPIWAVIPAPPPPPPPPGAPPVPPGAPPAPPVVVAQIQAPELDDPAMFGEALWTKVFTTELDRPVALEELMGEILGPQVHTEIEWQLLQRDPGDPAAGILENGGLGPVGGNAESVIRRYEFFKYTGLYKPADHEALPMFGDSNPDPSEIGNFIGAQNAGLNLAPLAAPGAVPEPGTLLLLGSGLAALRRRRLQV